LAAITKIGSGSLKKRKILVVDDEKGIRDLLHGMLKGMGYEAFSVEDAEIALALLVKDHYDLVITDMRLPGQSGEEFLKKIKALQPIVPVVVISGYGSTKKIVDVIKNGAEDYLSKPFTHEDLEVVVLKALEKRRLLEENKSLRNQITDANRGFMVGNSTAIQKVGQLVEKFAPSGANVLILGESGVGKDLAARAIHYASSRASKPLVQVNSGALPANLFEAELFGVKKGAFTGAQETREGLFQTADGGTLFLDEIAEIPMESQAKLLRVLESGEVRLVGDSKSRKVDVRVIAATNQNLEEMVEQKTFRKDLYYRLSVLVLSLPPLRERLGDIPLLTDYFLREHAGKGQTPQKISAQAMKWLLSRQWPGNVRELKNHLERARLLTGGSEIQLSDLAIPSLIESPGPGGSFRESKKSHVQAFEKKYLADLLRESKGNVSLAARSSGLARRNFQLLLKKYKLKPTSYRG
jgi:DNA-binding NtrC family response regulator